MGLGFSVAFPSQPRPAACSRHSSAFWLWARLLTWLRLDWDGSRSVWLGRDVCWLKLRIFSVVYSASFVFDGCLMARRNGCHRFRIHRSMFVGLRGDLGSASRFIFTVLALTALSPHRIGVHASRRAEDALDGNNAEDTLAQTTFINGVPVYNYQHAYHALTDESLSKLTNMDRRQTLVDWILVFPRNESSQIVSQICVELPKAACLWKGSPDQGGVPALVVRCTEAQLEGILQKHPTMEFVEPDQPISVPPDTLEDNDTSADDIGTSVENNDTSDGHVPWGLDRINARTGLDGFYGVVGGAGVHVYVMDTGIRRTHQDFGDRAIPTLEIVGNAMRECMPNDTECAVDFRGHGTHCAGIVGGSRSGVAKLSTLHAIKVFQRAGRESRGRWSWIIESMDYVATRGQRPAVISVGIGGVRRGRVAAAETAIDTAVAAGVPVVVSAGNANDDACEWTPGFVGFVGSAITVGATRRDDRKANFSNAGPCLGLFAPGSSIPSASHTSDTEFRRWSGTSMAAAHVAGAAALLLADKASMTPAEVFAELLSRVTQDVVMGSDIGSQSGLLYVPTAPGEIVWATVPTKCMDVRGGDPRNGNPIVLWDRLGNINQQFTVPPLNAVGTFRWNGAPAKCLDVAGGNANNGNPIHLWDCLPGNHPHQQFRATLPPDGKSAMIRWETRPTKCLDVRGGDSRNGNPIVLWDCAFSYPNQRFWYIP